MTNPLIKFNYRNHRGVVSERRVLVDSIEFIREPGFGYQSGWFISGYDGDKKARRSFALSNVVMDPDQVPKFFQLIKWDRYND